MRNHKRIQENSIDSKYRKLVFQYYLGDIKESKNSRVLKYEFSCPFCSSHRKGSKKNAKCSALFWVEYRGCFKFQCFNAGSSQCKYAKEFPKFLEALNPALFREYQLERYHAGTTGGRWNCPHPPEVLNLTVNGGGGV